MPLIDERLINVKALPALLPPGRDGKRINYSTLWRWILRGVTTPAGKVRLEALKCGSRWVTSHEALERFLLAQTPRLDEAPALPRRSTTRRQKHNERVERQLETLGI